MYYIFSNRQSHILE
uniref:Uncharacterized protein n=1 Tax=Arundo donax TaxID=35708 RepID=A0A0A9CPT0_ARUDO